MNRQLSYNTDFLLKKKKTKTQNKTLSFSNQVTAPEHPRAKGYGAEVHGNRHGGLNLKSFKSRSF